MKKIITLILLGLSFFITKIILGQVQQEWIRWFAYNSEYGENVSSAIALDSAGNIYITGICHYSMNSDIVTIKYNTDGVQQWAQRFEAGGDYNPQAIAIDRSGNIYVTGSSTYNTEMDKYTTLKYEPVNGNVLWIREYPPETDSSGFACAIAIDDNNNIYIAGSAGVIKYDPMGNLLWHSSYRNVNGMILDKLSNLYITGSIFNNFIVAKYNSSGVQQWLGYTGGSGVSLGIDDSLNVYATGNDYDVNYYRTQKFSHLGVWQWTKFYRRFAQLNPKILVDNLGNSYVSGTTPDVSTYTSDYLLIKYSADGSLQWVQTFNGLGNTYDYCTSISMDHLGYIYVSGLTDLGLVHGRFTTLKYNSNGNMIWSVNTVGNYISDKCSMVIDEPDKIYITGGGSSYGSFPSEYITIKYVQYDEVKKIGGGIPESFQLHQNYPNPFNPFTTIKYDVPNSSLVTIKVYDIAGRLVSTLINERQSPGTYEVKWDASNFDSGIYFYRLETESYNETRKMVLVK